jgi:hypothetical protein
VNEQLGKIKSIRFGYGGYQDAMIGFTFELGGDSWGTIDFWGQWAYRSKDAKWTEEERALKMGEYCIKVKELLVKAKKQDLQDLKGVPVRVFFGGDLRLSSWQLLEEVL